MQPAHLQAPLKKSLKGVVSNMGFPCNFHDLKLVAWDKNIFTRLRRDSLITRQKSSLNGRQNE